jgi:hypothetical protein
MFIFFYRFLNEIFIFIKAHEKCKQIQGFLVEFPLDFAADDVIMPKWSTTEGFFHNNSSIY